MLRVVYVIDSLRAGGAEQSLVSMADALIDHGADLTVVTLRDGGELEPALAETGARHLSLGSASGWRSRVRNLAGLVEEIDAHVVHTTLYDADLAGRLAATRRRRPVCATLTTTRYDDAWAPHLPSWKRRSVQIAEAASARLCRRMHAVSATVADHMAAKLRYPRERIEVIHRGRDPRVLGRRSAARSREVRGRLGLTTGDPLLVTVGRQDHVKGIDTVVEAFGLMATARPDAVLVVAGRAGDDTPGLESMVEAEGLTGRVRFLGHRDDVADLIAAADVVMSGARREGLPGALVEALGLEAPTVATDLPQNREVLASSGTYVPVGDAAAMSQAVLDVLSDPRGAATRAASGRRHFDASFRLDGVAAAMVDLWERIARSHRGGA